MRSLSKIGIKFCGNCNPQIKTKEILLDIKQSIINKKLDIQLVSWDTSDITDVLILCGCPVDCAARPDDMIVRIIIAGETVNYHPCSAAEIAGKVIEILNCQKRAGSG